MQSGANLTVNGLTIQDGLSTSTHGGGIANVGTLTLSNSTVDQNQAVDGGGIDNFLGGALTITKSTVADNVAAPNSFSADSAGGGIDTQNADSTLTLANSTAASNMATNASNPHPGGGLSVRASVSASGSIVANNSGGNCNFQDSAGPITDTGYNLESGTDCDFTGTGSLQNTAPPARREPG